MIETRIDALDFLAQLGGELVSTYEAVDETITTIVTALLAMQIHTNPITLGTIEPTVTRSIEVEDQQDSILGVIMKLRGTVGGYIEVDNSRQLNWWIDIGEDKGQQIRYKKNVIGLSRTLEYSNFGNRIYCYGAGEGTARIILSDATSAKMIGSDTTGTTNLNLNMFQLNKFTTDTVVINKIKVYCRVNGNVKVAVYKDDNGEPGDLIVANNTGQAVTSGQWNTLNIDSMCLEAGDYWLAAICDTTGAISRNAGASTRRAKTVAYAGFSFPDPAGIGFTPVTTEMSIAGWFVAGDDYVEDTPSQDTYGICIQPLTDKSISNPDVLLAWAALQLLEMKDPRHSYRVDMVNLAAMGWDFEALQLGSFVKVIDEDLGIDIDARIVKIIRDLSDPQNIQVEISNPGKDILDTMGGVYDTQQFLDQLATKIGAGQVTVLGAFTVSDWVTGGTTNIIGSYIRTGTIESTNWGAGAGSQYNLDDGTFKLGGSAAPKLSWDGTTLIVSGTIYATAGEFTGTLKATTLEGGKTLTISGTISAGGGNVLIDSTGLKVKGAAFYIQDAGGTTQGYISGGGSWGIQIAASASGGICLSPVGSYADPGEDKLMIIATEVWPSPTGSVDFGNATYYWNEINYKTLTDRGCPMPVFKSYTEAIMNMKTRKRKLTIAEAKREGMGSRAIERIKKYGTEIEEFDLNTFPEDLLSIPIQKDYDNAEEIYQKQLKGAKDPSEVVKYEPKKGYCLNEIVYSLVKSQQEIVERIKVLEAS